MTKQMSVDLGGSFTLLGTSMTVNRMGYGAMQLAGEGVWGPPHDRSDMVDRYAGSMQKPLRSCMTPAYRHHPTIMRRSPHSLTSQLHRPVAHAIHGHRGAEERETAAKINTHLFRHCFSPERSFLLL